jgi:uncharacterized damage-inducible protein DinB
MTEAWLLGPLEGVPPILMPVAHSLTDAWEEIPAACADLSPDEVWHRPGGAASVGFHLRHIPGSIDRLLAYTRGERLSAEQFAYLRAEGESGTPPAGVEELLEGVRTGIDQALAAVRMIDADEVLQARSVGRSGLPSTVLGLLFHVAEHTRRHSGQVIATASIIRGLDLTGARARVDATSSDAAT